MTETEDKYYTITEAMKILGIKSRSTIFRWIRENKIRSTKYQSGRTCARRIPASDIDAMKVLKRTAP